MQYKPENQDLLEAIAEFLRKDILSYVKERDDLVYKTLVSWNMLNVVIRDLEKEELYLIKEIERLSDLLNISLEIPLTLKEKREKVKDLNRKLCELIKNQKISIEHPIWEHVKKTLIENLSISNPRFQL
ncbi:MAG: hypothetical protein KatS3mg129_0479 [Leptospiraceae bacterium]|nr:MAG: hypothetical protein KatS3mg129_0479 [Leptospiraceae bacterium]